MLLKVIRARADIALAAIRAFEIGPALAQALGEAPPRSIKMLTAIRAGKGLGEEFLFPFPPPTEEIGAPAHQRQQQNGSDKTKNQIFSEWHMCVLLGLFPVFIQLLRIMQYDRRLFLVIQNQIEGITRRGKPEPRATGHQASVAGKIQNVLRVLVS